MPPGSSPATLEWMAPYRRRHPDQRIPEVRVVGGDGDWDRPSLRSRMNGAVESVRPAISDTVSVIFGLWPLFAVMALTIGLLWSAALGGSP